jgi:hippurate hydrolase
VGTIATKPDPSRRHRQFHATFRGKGTHGAYPHLGADPIDGGGRGGHQRAEIRLARDRSDRSCVVTIGKMSAGTAVNVIPDSATIEATVRKRSPSPSRTYAQEARDARMRGIALANNCQLEWTWLEGLPRDDHDPAMADYVATVARATFGPNQFIPVAKSSMGGEDFAYYHPE